MAAAPDADVNVNITCQVSNALLGWDAAGTTDIGADPSGDDVTWAIGTVVLTTAYTSHTAGTNPEAMTLKNWGGADLDVTATIACATGWSLAVAGNNQFQMRYRGDFTDAAPDTALTSGLQILDEFTVGTTKFLALELTTPVSVSGAGLAAQTIVLTLTGTVD